MTECDRHPDSREPSPIIDGVCIRCGPKVRDDEDRIGAMLQKEFDR